VGGYGATVVDEHQLAQVNVARLREPLDSPRLSAFVSALEPVNALADGAPGFVWRLQEEGGDATGIRAFDDEHVIVNLSVWTSLEALWRFAYGGGHLEVMRRRREWFEPLASTYFALWWVPEGTIPTVADARARLELLDERGPTPAAFDFKHPFTPDGRALPSAELRDRARASP